MLAGDIAGCTVSARIVSVGIPFRSLYRLSVRFSAPLTRRMRHAPLSRSENASLRVSWMSINSSSTAKLRSLKLDANPAMVLADVVSSPHASEPKHKVPSANGPAVYKNFSSEQLETVEARDPDFTVVFTEDKNGFYINGKRFAIDSAPMLRARIGSLQRWRIVNATNEVHPFHIHQVHFLAYAINGVTSEVQEWLDTVNVPYGSTVDLVLDFTDPVIRGVSVFHCHLLSHEDKGMMEKIVFE